MMRPVNVHSFAMEVADVRAFYSFVRTCHDSIVVIIIALSIRAGVRLPRLNYYFSHIGFCLVTGRTKLV